MSYRAALVTVVGLVVVLASGQVAHATCTRGLGRVELWPEHTIGPGGLLVVTLYVGQESQLDDAAAEIRAGTLYLESRATGLRIQLEPLELAERDRADGFLQALMRPVVPLDVGDEYQLTLGGQTFFRKVVAATAAPLAWSRRARVVERTYFAGCPLDSQLVLDAPVAPADDPMIELRGRSPATAEPFLAFLPVEDGRVVIHHDLCSGGLALAAGAPYQLELTALDRQGQRAVMPGLPLLVTAPGPGDPEPGWAWPDLGPDPQPRLSTWLAGATYGLGLIGLGLLVALVYLVRARRPDPLP
jgi:hypothetical protein